MKNLSKMFRWVVPIMVCGLFMAVQSCNSVQKEKSSYCTADDFEKMQKIDIHCHITVDRHCFMEQAIADNFRILTINVDAFEHPTIEEQQ